MSVFPTPWTFDATVVGISKDFGTLDLQGYSYVKILGVSNVNYQLNLRWSMNNGIDTDFVDSSLVQVAGSTWDGCFPVRSRFLNLSFVDDAGIGGAILRVQVSLN